MFIKISSAIIAFFILTYAYFRYIFWDSVQLWWIRKGSAFIEGLFAGVILAILTLVNSTIVSFGAIAACLSMYFIIRNNIYLNKNNYKSFALGYLLFSIFFIPPTIAIFYFIMFIVMKKSGF